MYIFNRLNDKLPLQDYHSLNGALLSANSVLKRYRYTFKSDALFNELKHIVLPHMAVRSHDMTWHDITSHNNRCFEETVW